jgi:4-azaleucine resistance transporter AzlC
MTDVPDATPRIRDGMRAAIPLAPSPILFGLSYGVLADATGFGAAAAVVMSATTFAGAAQFASVSVLDAGGTVAAAVLAAVFLNARYVAISVTISSIFPGRKLRRLVEAQAIVDESWALSGRHGRFEWPILVGSGLVFYVLWVGSTAAGTAIGGVLEDPNALGLDAAFAALFLALAVPYLRERRALQAAALAAVITLVLTPFTPAGVPIIAAAGACLLGLFDLPTARADDEASAT